ncbi:LamG-like jellyroll fold domain-containing protein [Desulfonema magnum]|uniref:receptor protein-tyrosine kinase n=1 Tax=Desulfonema magnum TaxID=45655 RepID=A0A975BP15_9BACT|nr:LamG-like jellyroll fold domain-containing protein [Desulfonema magnum]QTA89077.1 Regulator of chromosome condensation domains-containing protein [Desulfonema magnum]
MIRTFKFNGTDNYILLGDTDMAKDLISKAFTIEAWVRQADHHIWTGFVGIMEDKGEIEKGWMLGIPFGRRCSFALASLAKAPLGGFTYLRDDMEFPLNRWRHLAGVYDGEEMRFYVNGQLMGISGDQSGGILYPENAKFVVGAFIDQDETYPFYGSIAEVRLWNIARSEEEINGNMNKRLDGSKFPDIVGYWPLRGDKDGYVDNWALGKAEQTGEIKGSEVVWIMDESLTLGGFTPAPPPPQIVEPDPEKDIRGNAFIAKWQAVAEADCYYLDVSTDPDFAAFVAGFENKKVTDTKQAVSGLTETTKYYFRVRSENEDGIGISSMSGSVTTLERSSSYANYCAELTAANDHIDVCPADTIKLLFRQAFTAEIWIKPSEIQEKGGYLGVIEDEIEQQGWLLGSRNGRFCFAISSQGRMDSISQSDLTYLKTEKDHKPGTWYHLAGVYTGTKMQLYVNGNMEAESEVQSGDINYPVTDPGNPKQGRFVIGVYQDSIDFIPFKGKLAEARIWNTMRSAEELKKYMQWRVKPEDHPQLVGCWRCDESAGSVVADCAKNNNGVLKGDKAKWGDADELSLYRPLEEIKQIAAGPCHTVALAQDGTVWTWGQNDFGQLGDGTTIDRVAPVQVKTKENVYLGNVEEVAVGKYFTLARTKENTVLAWGSNFYGQLGNETNEDSLVPVQVKNLSGVVTISAYNNHAMALKEDGSVFTWGRNNKGQLGNGSTASEIETPKSVLGFGGDDYADLTNASYLGLKDGDFTVEAWINSGAFSGTDTVLGTDGNINGQTLCLGMKDGKPHLGFLNNDLTSKTDLGINVWHHIAWRYTKAEKEMAIFVDGRLEVSEKDHEPFQGSGKLYIGRSQGGNYFNGNVADLRVWNRSRSESEIETHIQRRMSGKEAGLAGYWRLDQGTGTDITDSAGDHDGTISGATWKASPGLLLYEGQSNNVPVQVKIENAEDPVVAIAAGGEHSAVMTKKDTKTRVFAWGDNTYGQLGNNSKNANNTPAKVFRDADGGDFPYAKGIAAGFYHTVMLSLSNDHIYACGANDSSQLGYNAEENTKLPVRIKDKGDYVTWRNGTAIDRIGIGPQSERLRLAAAGPVPLGKDEAVGENDKPGMIRYNPDSCIAEYCDGNAWAELVKPFPGAPGDIAGAKRIFPSAEVTYSVEEAPGASGYEWSVTGAAITGGQGSKSIAVKSGNKAYTVSVKTANESGKSRERSIRVSIKSMETKIFDYSGKIESWRVPAGIGLIRIEAWGAQGGTANSKQEGGKGGYAKGDRKVSQRETLYICIGGQGNKSKSSPVSGGYNGGGTAYNYGNTSWIVASGGGASDVRIGGSELKNRIIVAGGGGGTGRHNSGCCGGDGGGLEGKDGGCNSNYSTSNGKGGSQNSGGSGGKHNSGNGMDGSLGFGGNSCKGHNILAGGGGGGYYGGGGGGYHMAGGGGGSSYIGGLTNASTQAGVRSGNGQVIISW